MPKFSRFPFILCLFSSFSFLFQTLLYFPPDCQAYAAAAAQANASAAYAAAAAGGGAGPNIQLNPQILQYMSFISRLQPTQRMQAQVSSRTKNFTPELPNEIGISI